MGYERLSSWVEILSGFQDIMAILSRFSFSSQSG